MKTKIKEIDEQIAKVHAINHVATRNKLLRIFTARRNAVADKIGRKQKS